MTVSKPIYKEGSIDRAPLADTSLMLQFRLTEQHTDQVEMMSHIGCEFNPSLSTRTENLQSNV